MADSLSSWVTERLASAARDCDELSSFLKSPEAKRRLAPATRSHLQATVIDRKLKAAEIAFDVAVKQGQLVPLDAWDDLMKILVEALDPPALEALKARLRSRLPGSGWAVDESATEQR